jgi:hypothetical protein
MVERVDYSRLETPIGYVCGVCGAKGVRLFRRYQTFLDAQALTCTPCSEAKQSTKLDPESPCAIGWLVLAVPTEDGETYWGYTSVPEAGMKWWFGLRAALDDAEKGKT